MNKQKPCKNLKLNLWGVFVMMMVFGSARNVNAQNFQVWLDGFLTKQISEKWEYEANIGTNRLVQRQGWSDNYFVNTFAWKIKPWYASEGCLEFHETVDPLSSDIREIRPWIAQRFILPRYFPYLHLSDPYFYARLDQRFLWYPEEDVFDAKTRLRLRLGGEFLIKNRLMKEDIFFIPLYFEGYINFAGHAIESYASTVKALTGLGYVASEKLHVELLYCIMGSKDTAGDQATQTDNIVNLQVKYYLH